MTDLWIAAMRFPDLSFIMPGGTKRTSSAVICSCAFSGMHEEITGEDGEAGKKFTKNSWFGRLLGFLRDAISSFKVNAPIIALLSGFRRIVCCPSDWCFGHLWIIVHFRLRWDSVLQKTADLFSGSESGIEIQVQFLWNCLKSFVAVIHLSVSSCQFRYRAFP